MNRSTLFKSLVATIVIIALGIPVIASADDKSELQGKSLKVSYADLNLQKQEGAKVLYRRLELASKQVCDLNRAQDEGSAKRMSDARQCYKLALTAAVEEIDNELLTQIHNN